MNADKIVSFQSRKEKDEYEKLKREAIGEKAYKLQKKQEYQAMRNLAGIELEKAGKIEEAILLYEKNVKERFDGNHPYDRLAIIYRRTMMIEDEIRTLEKAINVFENIEGQGYVLKKVESFKKRLDKAKLLRLKLINDKEQKKNCKV